MRKLMIVTLSLVATIAFSGMAFAAGDALTAKISGQASTLAAAAIGMAIAAFGCGIGQDMGLKGACEGTARNPEAGGKIMVTLILGLAFIESLGIYALVVNLILLFANPIAAIAV